MNKSFFLLSSMAVIISTATTTFKTEFHPLSDEFINAINAKQSLWKAGRNFREDTPISYLRHLRGRRRINGKQRKLSEFRHNLADVKIPDSFDWRDHYPTCSTIRDIRDQGSCGSCWAFATVEVISDRICIHSKGKRNAYISAEDLISCCDVCGNGCYGGNEYLAFDYWTSAGIVSGGPYGSNQGCQPYEIPPCDHVNDVNGTHGRPCSVISPTPNCNRLCRVGYSKTYKEDLHFGKTSYSIPNDVKQIQVEIMTNGPVVAAFTAYDDFFHYKTGVYKHTKGTDGGLHAVKIIGWGVENDTPYWLIANSWNTDFGELGGFFKFLRGENHCDIEEYIAAGIPA